MGLGLGLVVGLGTVLLLFFLALFWFRCRLKEQKLPPGRLSPWLSGYRVHIAVAGSRVRIQRETIFLRFLNFSPQSVLYITLWISFRLKVSFRVTVTVTVGLGLNGDDNV